MIPLSMAPAYECDRCGACCERLIVEVDEIDLAREPRLKAVVEPFKVDGHQEEYTDQDGRAALPLVPGFEHGGLLACGKNMPCGMLGADKKCGVYPTRPNVCVAFRAGSEACQTAREMAGLAPLPEVCRG